MNCKIELNAYREIFRRYDFAGKTKMIFRLLSPDGNFEIHEKSENIWNEIEASLRAADNHASSWTGSVDPQPKALNNIKCIPLIRILFNFSPKFIGVYRRNDSVFHVPKMYLPSCR